MQFLKIESLNSQKLAETEELAVNVSESKKNNWEQQKAYLLTNFTTTATLTFTSSFLQPSENSKDIVLMFYW